MGFLLIFAMVNLVAYKRADDIGANKLVTLSACLLCMAALITLTSQQWRSDYKGTIIALTIIIGSFMAEYLYKKSEKKERASKNP